MTVDQWQPPALDVGTPDFARWVAVLKPAAALAERIADTEFVPEAMRGNAPMVCAAIMYGDELGVGPMQALQGINVIRGKPSPSSELMRALVFRAGHSIAVLTSDGQKCRVVGKRKGEQNGTVIEWTIEMARAAGLPESNPTWRRYPRAMLLARATSELCRVVFPDVVKGLGHVIDDDSTAEGFDDWSSEATGEPPAPPPEPLQRAPRGVTSHELPEPTPPETGSADSRASNADGVGSGTEPPDDGPRYPDSDEQQPDWPAGVSQPPLPEMPRAAESATAGHPPSAKAEPAAAPPEPMPVPDDNEPERELQVIGSGRLLQTIQILYRDLGLTEDDRPLKLAIASAAVGRKVTSTKLLTRREGLTLVRILNDMAQEQLTFGINPDGTVDIYPPDEREPTP